MYRKEQTIRDYHERINKVLVFINKNLDKKLDLNQLAKISNFSKYHFHKIMKAHLGESLLAYIIRIRLEAAVGHLEFSKDSISEIAYRVGYETPSSFTKAFKKRFGVSPNEFRINKTDYKLHFDILKIDKTLKEMELKPKIKDIKPQKVVFIQTIGSYNGEGIGKAWSSLYNFIKVKRLFSFKNDCYGVSYDDPHVTEAAKCRYDACVTVNKDVNPEGEVGFKELEGGKYAIFFYKGPYSGFQAVYDDIYRNWLPQSEHELRDAPPMEKYLNDPNKAKPENLKTEIYVPIE